MLGEFCGLVTVHTASHGLDEVYAAPARHSFVTTTTGTAIILRALGRRHLQQHSGRHQTSFAKERYAPCSIYFLVRTLVVVAKHTNVRRVIRSVTRDVEQMAKGLCGKTESKKKSCVAACAGDSRRTSRGVENPDPSYERHS